MFRFSNIQSWSCSKSSTLFQNATFSKRVNRNSWLQSSLPQSEPFEKYVIDKKKIRSWNLNFHCFWPSALSLEKKIEKKVGGGPKTLSSKNTFVKWDCDCIPIQFAVWIFSHRISGILFQVALRFLNEFDSIWRLLLNSRHYVSYSMSKCRFLTIFAISRRQVSSS